MAAYGRLDVYWPDGPIESYPLSKPVIAIGRSTGNDVVLDTTAVSRYHISISLEGDKVVLKDLDAVNGTYVDGVRMAGSATRVLIGGEEIQIGDVRLIFQPKHEETTEQIVRRTKPQDAPLNSVDSPVHDDSPVDGVEERPTLKLSPIPFKVVLDTPDQTVTPGAHNQALLDVQNTGSEPDRYVIEIDGLPKEWTRLDRAEIELAPDVHTQVVVNFKPARRSDSKPGNYPYTIRVTSRNHPNITLEKTGTMHLLNYSGFGIVLGTPRVQAGSGFEVYIQNQGSAPLVLGMTGADPGSALTFDMPSDAITLAPGERRIIRGQLRSKRQRFIGAAREHRFDIIAHARDASGFQAAVSGMYAEKPGLPAWLPALLLPLIAGVALIAVIVVIGGLLVLPSLQATRTPQPTIQPTVQPILAPTQIPLVVLTLPTAAPVTNTPLAVIVPSVLPTLTATPTLTTVLTLSPTVAASAIPPNIESATPTAETF